MEALFSYVTEEKLSGLFWRGDHVHLGLASLAWLLYMSLHLLCFGHICPEIYRKNGKRHMHKLLWQQYPQTDINIFKKNTCKKTKNIIICFTKRFSKAWISVKTRFTQSKISVITVGILPGSYKFWRRRICKKYLRELTWWLTQSQLPPNIFLQILQNLFIWWCYRGCLEDPGMWWEAG